MRRVAHRGGKMPKYETIEDAKAGARGRRSDALSTRADKATKKLDKGEDEVKAHDMVGIWNSAATNITADGTFHCPRLSKKDEGRIKGRLNELLETQPNETYSAGQFLLQFFTWVIEEWSTMRARHGTGWMHQKDMLPRHPEMNFVVHHWKFFRQAYGDRHREKGFDFVTPEVDELREEVGLLKNRVRDRDRFDGHEALSRLQEKNRKLQQQVDELSAKVPVDLDSDLPEWEEEPDD